MREGVWAKLLLPAAARRHGLLATEDEVAEDGFKTQLLWEVITRGLEYKETWRRIGR